MTHAYTSWKYSLNFRGFLFSDFLLAYKKILLKSDQGRHPISAHIYRHTCITDMHEHTHTHKMSHSCVLSYGHGHDLDISLMNLSCSYGQTCACSTKHQSTFQLAPIDLHGLHRKLDKKWEEGGAGGGDDWDKSFMWKSQRMTTK